MIRLNEVHISPEAEELVLGVLRSGQLAQAEMVAEFERRFSALAGTASAVAVSSGTTALTAAFEAQGIGPGDAVATSPMTFVATLNAILAVGATAQFVDVRDDDLTMDADALRSALSDVTRCVVPVHLYGYPADMATIAAVAARHGACVVEDAAQAHGASVAGRPVGSFGTGCFSLYATKNLTTGEGGVVTTDDDEVASRLRLLRNHGMRGRYEYELAGRNYRMTEVQAAIGVAEIARLADLNARRRRHAEHLTERLGDCPGLTVPKETDGRRHVYHLYTIRLTPDAAVDRDTLARELAARGIESGVFYPRPVFDYDCFRDHPRIRAGDTPVARRAARQVLSLPVHPWLSEADLDTVAGTVRDVLTRGPVAVA